MSLRNPAAVGNLTKRASQATISRLTNATLVQRGGADQSRNFATPVPPVTQDATGRRGPTAMVLMNMGGPSSTDEVGGFLSRLFVCISYPAMAHSC
jgi:ferrochelatase